MGKSVKILLAAPTGWATDALCGFLTKLLPEHELRLVPDARSLLHPDQARADLLLLDIDGAVADVTATLSELSRSRHYDRIVVIGTPLDSGFIESVLAAGALGYLPKSYSETITVGMLRLVLDGMSDPAEGLPPAGYAASADRTAAAEFLELGLSPRQIDVLALIAEGKSNLSIAAHLGIEEGTVKQHVSAVFKALKVRNRAEAVLFASRSKSINFRQIRQAEGGRLDIDWLLGHMDHQHLARDTVMFSKGEPGRELYYLQRGKVQLREIGVDLGAGTMFGEIGIFSPTHERTCSAVCMTEVEVFRLTADEVKRLYLLHPQFALYVVHLIAQRLMADRSRAI